MKNNHFNAFGILLILTLMLGLVSCSEDDEIVPSQDVEFGVSPTSMSFPASGGNSIINVNNNGEWDISTDADWLTFSNQSATQSSKITLTAMANSDTTARTATLMVNGIENSQEIQVTQEGAEPEPVEQEITFAIPPDNTGISDLGSADFADQMIIGWNLGNSLEAVGEEGETSWNNPVVTQRLIDSVKAAGFNAVRIPIAWSKFSDEASFTIEDAWMNRVEEVVNYVISNDMYAIINIHWDGGWMQPTYEEEDYVNQRLDTMWTQIATNFRDYDDHLLFAGTNEVLVEGDYGTPTEEYYTVQNGFNQTFVNSVRSTGGKNAYRYLVVQGFNTNIDHTVNFFEMPEDVDIAENRLMVEVHYYDPYNFALNEDDSVWQWGNDAEDASLTAGWANEDHVDNQFQRMQTNFVDEGVGVILGEYGAIARDVEGHEVYRLDYLQYVTHSAAEHGMVSFYWDNGDIDENGFGIFDRSTGETLYPEVVETIINAAQSAE
ncbi:cellulase family glycosylhydrolase [Autumnicola musiva]|uniref:Cellulase family glycosylhydrolase n=1 Tax=Autumnicola musiva TaxID=3075589 RepID=A0ABU3D144_9FLAO|nr:cellulase family glycosylhydrolase [Zunongwangia sp. F117]MDT0675266.1 cellulase family glycosylhydrolase [Zunongwangia sp. F117]